MSTSESDVANLASQATTESAVKANLFSIFGPGVMFAVAAIGTSHIVQSTRAGADYGLYMWLIIVGACVIRYPAFRAGADYASISGRTLIDNYFDQGKWAVAIFLLDLMVNMFLATAAVSLVTGGILRQALGLSFSDTSVGVAVVLLVAALLMVGRYRLVERICKMMLLLLSIVVIVATVMSLPKLQVTAADLWPSLAAFDRDGIFFTVALAGWMPTALIAGTFQSLWVKARTDVGMSMSPSQVAADFNMGYGITLFLALCFLLLGNNIVGGNTQMAPSSGAFSLQLVDVIASFLGAWSAPLLMFAISAIMLSTVIALMDACPRAVALVVNHKSRQQSSKPDVLGLSVYRKSLAFQGAVVILLLLFVAGSFRQLLDFATTLAFLLAPLLAFINHRALYHSDIVKEQQPGFVLRWWSLAGLSLMAIFSVMYLYIRFFY